MSHVEADPLLALQGAMYAHLRAAPALQALFAPNEVRVFDRVTEKVFPYLKIGEDRCLPVDHECAAPSIVFSTVRAYTRAVGRVQAKQLGKAVRFSLLPESGFSVPEFSFSYGHCTGVETHEHEDGVTVHAEINFEYRLVPLEPPP